MRLPVKLLPKRSHHIGSAIGAGLIMLLGIALIAGYLPDRSAAEDLTFGQWIGANSLRLPFLLISSAVLLFGLAALTVALLNLFAESPFTHLIVDRFGIRSRTFFGERRWSWKDLGPIRPLRLSALRAYGLDRRFWIVSDTFSGEDRNDLRRPLSSFNLRIPVAAYLGSSWSGASIEPAIESMAAWLDALRQLARDDALDPDAVPDAPDALDAGMPHARPATDTIAPELPDLPPMADRKFGRRDGPTVER